MSLTQTIQGIPTNLLIFAMLTIFFGTFLYISGNWNQQTQMIIAGVIIVLILMGVKESKKKITLEEAKIIALDWVRKKKQTGIIEQGTPKESIEGITRQRNGIEWYHDVCITVENPTIIHYLLSIALDGKIIQTSERKSWTTKDSANVEIVTPPDFLTWWKMRRKIDEQLDEVSE